MSMKREDRIFLSIAAAYVIAGLLTFGWTYNHSGPAEGYTFTAGAENNRQMMALLQGILWPIYGAGRVALLVTRWP